jgi:CRP-like cAMP-binding protein
VDSATRPRPFLDGLAAADVAALDEIGAVVRRRRGEHVFHEGEATHSVWLLRSGFVKLTKLSLSGRTTVLELRGPGDILGEMGLIDGGPRSATVTALSPVVALSIEASRLGALLDARPTLARRLLEDLVARLRQASERQLELGTVEVLDRLTRRLVELADSQGEDVPSGVRIAGGISQQELADWCGTSRDSIVRALRELRDAGLVESGRSQVVILDLPSLRSVL